MVCMGSKRANHLEGCGCFNVPNASLLGNALHCVQSQSYEYENKDLVGSKRMTIGMQMMNSEGKR